MVVGVRYRFKYAIKLKEYTVADTGDNTIRSDNPHQQSGWRRADFYKAENLQRTCYKLYKIFCVMHQILIEIGKFLTETFFPHRK